MGKARSAPLASSPLATGAGGRPVGPAPALAAAAVPAASVGHLTVTADTRFADVLAGTAPPLDEGKVASKAIT